MVTTRRQSLSARGPKQPSQGGWVRQPCEQKPPFTVGQLRKAIPAHCWQRSAWRSGAYLAVDVLLLAALVYASSFIDTAPVPTYVKWGLLWPLYWFFAGGVGTGCWVRGCCAVGGRLGAARRVAGRHGVWQGIRGRSLLLRRLPPFWRLDARVVYCMSPTSQLGGWPTALRQLPNPPAASHTLNYPHLRLTSLLALPLRSLATSAGTRPSPSPRWASLPAGNAASVYQYKCCMLRALLCHELSLG